jgi:uncharacterized FAD-dependent dehydrogenase
MEILQISVLPEQAVDDAFLKEVIAEQFNSTDFQYKIAKRSIDARRKPVTVNLKLAIYLGDEAIPATIATKEYPNVSKAKPVIIVGFGPAGMFAALKLIEQGIKPIIIERGKDVRSRRRDLAAINKEHIVNPESNYCFGEGGAGTYSDGKLYTRSKKRGDVNDILATLVQHGAPEDIMVDAHPHIGTNKLPNVVTAIRETILTHGGEIHFNTKLTDFVITNNQVEGVVIQGGETLKANNVILATGHSARDIFYLLNDKGIAIESKPFALGVRVEHPQKLIDSIQYHCKEKERSEYLPPASYNLVQQVKQRGVFSFCMCPGGIIAPCATAPGEIVTNGWSPSKRNNPYANSGVVVSVEQEDLAPYSKYGALAGLEFQKAIEQSAFKAAGNKDEIGQYAPAQRLLDFVRGQPSSDLPECSYTPGIVSTPLHEVLPNPFVSRLQEGFTFFGHKMRGYLTNDAVIVGVESRTSSPVKIPRDRETLQHPNVKGLYPCGEGAGYAGGIVSAAIDGQKCAEAIAQS